MRAEWETRGERGTVLLFVMVLSVALAFAVTVLLQQGELEARATRVRLGSVRALYEAYGELEKARSLIASSPYDRTMRNEVVQAAVSSADGRIPGTLVEIARMTGSDGTWYNLTARVPYAEHYERVVTQAFREVDFFSSYNLFVADDPAGISGNPIGAIHSNEKIQFYFPGGLYRHSLTAVQGHEFKSGATPENTQILGPFDDGVARIDLDLSSSDRFNLDYLRANTEPAFYFDDSLNTKLRLYSNSGEQWIHVERWTKPEIRYVEYQAFVRYDYVNPRDEEYTYTERVSTGFETHTRTVQVLDHYETVQVPTQLAVYVTDTRTVAVPVYRTETATREVAVYRTETRYRTETQNVWVPADGSSGGTTVGGDSGTLGYWMPQEVQVPYTVQVLDHYDTETYSYQVVDHYDDLVETYERFDHYDTVYVDTQNPVYRSETQEYQVETFEDVQRTGTRTVYDQVPVYETRTRTEYIASALSSQFDRKAPSSGVVFSEANILALSGDVVQRLTIASGGSVTITGNLLYKDAEGDTAYLNGDKPWLPYSPNPAYEAIASLGVIAAQDVLYSRSMPSNAEINCSALAMRGRVGIDGIVLDSDGEVTAYNKFTDEWGRPISAKFQKNSLRRLGGITTAGRPVETVVKSGSIVSGFNIGQSVFDIGLLEAPPPYFLAQPTPRFFATTIEK